MHTTATHSFLSKSSYIKAVWQRTQKYEVVVKLVCLCVYVGQSHKKNGLKRRCLSSFWSCLVFPTQRLVAHLHTWWRVSTSKRQLPCRHTLNLSFNFHFSDWKCGKCASKSTRHSQQVGESLTFEQVRIFRGWKINSAPFPFHSESSTCLQNNCINQRAEIKPRIKNEQKLS